MWMIVLVLCYFLLALAAPVCWALWKVWRRTRGERPVTCPADRSPAQVGLDQWFAVRMHARGDAELRVLNCSSWPEHQNCARGCLTQVMGGR